MYGKDASALISMKVVTTAEGVELGRVKDLVFDPESQRLLGLLLDARDNDRRMFVEGDHIRGVGRDAITVDSAGSMHPLETQPRARRIVDAGIRLRGANVLTEDGDRIGRINKVMMEDDGSIGSYTTRSGAFGLGGRHVVLPQQVLQIGSDAVIVRAPETADDRVGRGLVGRDFPPMDPRMRRPADEAMER